MSDTKSSLERILETLSPDSLVSLVRNLAAQQPPCARDDVSVSAVLEVLLQGVDLGSPAEAWSAQLRIKRAMAEALANVPDVHYVEGDAS